MTVLEGKLASQCASVSDCHTSHVMVCAGIRDNFNVSDSDSDGKLSKNEFQSLPQELAKVDKFFELCDINSDSFVDMDELHTVLTGIQHRLTAFPSPSPSPPTL